MMQILTQQPKGFTMKNNTARRPRLSTTWKMLIGLTLFYFVGKTLGNR